MSINSKHSIPEVNEYLEAVKKEIQVKEIQESLILELYQHIEDSATDHIENGMPEADAWHYALISMGNASETGKEINRVHQKRNPVLPLLITGISCLIAILINTPLIRYYGMLSNNILYRVYAGIIILLLTYLGNLILKKNKLIYTIFAFIWGIYAFSYGFVFLGEHCFSNTDILFPCYTLISHSHTILFALSLLTILILSYSEANANIPFHFYSIIIFAAVCLLSKFFLKSSSLTAAFILTISFAAIVLYSKSNSQKMKYLKLFLIIFIFSFTQFSNIRSLFSVSLDDNFLIISLLKEARLFGKAYIFEDLASVLPKYFYTDYHIAYWILRYGILPACFLLAIVFSMYLTLYRAIQKISNNTHHLLALGCFICLFLQFILYFIGNFGLQLTVFPTFPIISEGISSITANAIFIGIILSLYRHDRVLIIR